MPTLHGMLAPGSVQLLNYIRVWPAVRLHHFEENPLDRDLNLVDTMRALTPDRKRHELATQYVGRTTVLERQLYGALALPFEEVKVALERRQSIRAWAQRRRNELLWMGDITRASFVLDSLHQVHNFKHLIEVRLSTWKTSAEYASHKKVLTKLYAALAATVRTRAQLAQHVADMDDLEALNCFFTASERRSLGVLTATQSARVYILGGDA